MSLRAALIRCAQGLANCARLIIARIPNRGIAGRSPCAADPADPKDLLRAEIAGKSAGRRVCIEIGRYMWYFRRIQSSLIRATNPKQKIPNISSFVKTFHFLGVLMLD